MLPLALQLCLLNTALFLLSPLAGTYKSWQCSDTVPGAYVALLDKTTTAPDGTKTEKVRRAWGCSAPS